MPATIKMTLSNGNQNRNHLANVFHYNSNFTAAIPPAPVLNAPLNTSMVGRVHNVKPGCGSCGRK